MNIKQSFETNVKAVLTEAKAYLNGVDVYVNHAPKSATLPYIVVRLESMIDTSPSYNATLKIVFYDDRNKTSQTNTLNADVMRPIFNKAQFEFEDMLVHSVLSLEQNIPSEYLADKQVIEQQFDVRIYERKQ